MELNCRDMEKFPSLEFVYAHAVAGVTDYYQVRSARYSPRGKNKIQCNYMQYHTISCQTMYNALPLFVVETLPYPTFVTLYIQLEDDSVGRD